MTTDPNADLIGRVIPGDEGEIVVTGTMPGNSAYVLCEPTTTTGSPTCRRASDVRLMPA